LIYFYFPNLALYTNYIIFFIVSQLYNAVFTVLKSITRYFDFVIATIEIRILLGMPSCNSSRSI